MGQKYLLTADHCFVDKADISNFQYWLLIFNYELPCRSRATPGPIRQVVQVACAFRQTGAVLSCPQAACRLSG